MLKFNASEFHSLVSWFSRALVTMEHRLDQVEGPIGPKDKGKLRVELTTLMEALTTLGANVTLIGVQDLISVLDRETNVPDYKLVVQKISELETRLRDELSLVHLFVLDGAKAQIYFEPSVPLFGTEFVSAFPSAAYELDEAGKCFALGRPTATVFHLMRIMEIGVRSVARCLGMPDPAKPGERNWGIILKNIKAEIDARNAQKQWARPLDRDFFESSYASLDAVRVAWRNTTMHVENKYSPEEAEHIFGAVRGFMRHLTSRCDEQGQPLA